MFSFSPNDFLACNGTRVGAQHLHNRMEALQNQNSPALTEQYPDLIPVISPIYATADFRPNPDRPRDHACLYFLNLILTQPRFAKNT